MKLIPANGSHIGSRKEQQDVFGFSDLTHKEFFLHGGLLMVLADGMGGLQFGREASTVAKQAFIKAYCSKGKDCSISEALQQALLKGNEAVVSLAQEKDVSGNLGTTLVAAVVHNEHLHWISAGDSRLYLYRKGELSCLTVDHNYLHELYLDVQKGTISKQDAENHPERNALTSFLGEKDIRKIEQNMKPIPLAIGDRIMVCSDGLYGTLSHKEILDCLAIPDPNKIIEKLIAAVLEKKRPNQDNTSIALMSCEKETAKTSVLSQWANKPKTEKLLDFYKILTGTLLLLLLTILWLWSTPSPQDSTPPGKTEVIQLKENLAQINSTQISNTEDPGSTVSGTNPAEQKPASTIAKPDLGKTTKVGETSAALTPDALMSNQGSSLGEKISQGEPSSEENINGENTEVSGITAFFKRLKEWFQGIFSVATPERKKSEVHSIETVTIDEATKKASSSGPGSTQNDSVSSSESKEGENGKQGQFEILENDDGGGKAKKKGGKDKKKSGKQKGGKGMEQIPPSKGKKKESLDSKGKKKASASKQSSNLKGAASAGTAKVPNKQATPK